MKRFLTAVLVAIAASVGSVIAWGQTGTPMSKGTLNNNINTIYQDNTTGLITPFLLRQGFLNVVSSMQQFGCVSAHTGTTYTFLTGDYGCLTSFQNPAGVTANLPAANSAGFNPWNTFISNYGSGNLTVVPTTGTTIGGLSQFVLTAQQGLWVVSDGSNYQFFLGSGGGGSGSLTIGVPVNGSTSNALLFAGPTNLLADNGPLTSLQFNTPTTVGGWSIGSTTSTGVIIAGKGTTYDLQLQNSLGVAVMSVPTATTNVIFNSLTTAGTIGESICATSAGLLIANAGTNCYVSGAGSAGGSNTQVQFNTNASFGGISGVTSDSAGLGITTATIVGPLTSGMSVFTAALSGTTGQFQTMTIVGLTPTGPNCLQETGGLVQATNASCGTGGGTPGGSNTQVQFNTNSTFGGISGATSNGSNVSFTTSSLVINGQAISKVSGTTGTLATVTGSLVSGNCLQSDVGHNLVDSGSSNCGGGGGSATPTRGGPLFPSSEYLGVAGGSLAPTFYIPTTTVGALEGIGMATQVSAAATATLVFNMPEIIPLGNMRLRVLQVSTGTSGAASFVIADTATTAASSSLAPTGLNFESGWTTTWVAGAADIVIERKLLLTLTPTSNQILTMLIGTTSTVGSIVVYQPSIVWE